MRYRKFLWAALLAPLCFSPARADEGYVEVGANVLPQFSVYGAFGGTFQVLPDWYAGVNLYASSRFDGSSPSVFGSARVQYVIKLIDVAGLYSEVAVGPELAVSALPDFSAAVGIKGSFYIGYDLSDVSGVYAGAYATVLQLGVDSFGLFFRPLASNGLYAGVYVKPIPDLKLEASAGLGFGYGVDFSLTGTATYTIGGGFSAGLSGGVRGNLSFGTIGPSLRVFGKYSF